MACVPALLLCLLAAAATAQTTISFTPDDGQFQCGQTWTIDVMVDALATDLRGCSLVVQYDSNAIRPISVTAGSLVAGAACANFLYWFGPSDADSVAVDVANLGCSVSGPGSVVRITFEGYAGGLSAITLRSGILRTGTNAPIPFTATGAQVRYDCAVGETASPWGSVKALYR
jgi:hypothetical protein